ncbi:polysaccharide biosynthesis protein [Caldibacillus lycopersici]|uniref:Polysaccharide biosynthesis protein n=1 Tax=Perspicuibacillus lycopersici TaxID=1325689 RepID=A0AAE3LNT8_9BACI|nr:polysaccharide biosynthesis protein [Perspicuibacillus lycopersici]MCU9614261.1 polysaccharide biosynthesis protein [Perspicuibacillus lycopersici]
MSSKLMRGTFILTLGTYISKFLGLFYVIPFFALVGKQGVALYQYGYVPYTIFISIATAGIPLAVSKFISKYNTLEEYAVGRKLFKSGMVIMLITGFAAFLILYFLSPLLADFIIPDADEVKNATESVAVGDVVAVIRAVSFALIVVPFMSLIRGFFQGHQSMGPSAVSQVVEQIVRIAFLLIGAFVVMKIIHGDIVEAVKVATFAAFVGAIGGLLVLFWYWIKRRPYLNELLSKDKGTVQISLKEIYKEIFISAIPFIIVGIANPMFQMVDTLTFNKTMVSLGMGLNEANDAFATLNYNSHKLVIIPVSLATAFSLTLVPMITKSYVNQNIKDLKLQLNQTFQVLLYLTLPAALGISLLAGPLYTVFYEADTFGAEILATYAPVAILFALFSVTAAILQGINEQRFTVFSLLLGLLIKLIINIPLIEAYETKGAIYATIIGYLTAIIINLFVIRYYANYHYRLVFRRGILIIIFNMIMVITVFFVYKILLLFLSPEYSIQSLIIIAICAIFGMAVYFYLSVKSRLIYFLFPEQMSSLKRRLS